MHVSRFKYHLPTYYTVLQDSGDYLAVGTKEHNKVILKNDSFEKSTTKALLYLKLIKHWIVSKWCNLEMGIVLQA